MNRMTALREHLSHMHESSERFEGGGAVLRGPAGYLSGFPSLFSPDLKRAFCFKNVAQAREVNSNSPIC
jgi:hypothetical protein